MVRDGGRGRRDARGRARDGVVQRGRVARPRRTSARSRRATRPTCSSSPTSRRFEPELVLKAAARRRHRAPRGPDWVQPHGAHPARRLEPDFRIPWEGGTARVIGLIPDQIVTESLVDEPTVVDGRRRWPTRAATWRRSRSSSATSARAAWASASCAASGCKSGRARLDGRARRAQHRRRRDRRRRHGACGRAADRDRRRRRRRGGARRPRRAARSRSPGSSRTRRSPRWSRRAAAASRRRREARLHLALAVPDAGVPRAVGDPEPEDHRPGLVDVDRFELVPLRADD